MCAGVCLCDQTTPCRAQFLVDAEGMPYARYSTVVDPVAITEDIRTLLQQEKDRVARLAARAQAQASDAATGRIARAEL